MTPILFLDYDGCIRLQLDEAELGPHVLGFCPKRIEWLAALCEETGACVVVSSDWRMDGLDLNEEYLGKLAVHLHADWCTPICGPRWREIEIWLADHPGERKFAVLDDVASLFDGAPPNIKDHLVLCSNRFGVVPEIIKEARALLA